MRAFCRRLELLIGLKFGNPEALKELGFSERLISLLSNLSGFTGKGDSLDLLKLFE